MVLVTLIVYLVVLLGIGIWARQRVDDSADFHLAGRRLGPVVASLSASASSSSVWTLLGMSGAAWLWGLQAVWLIPAVVSGFAINWFLVAPRLHRQSHDNQALTLVDFLSQGCTPAMRRSLRVIGAGLILFCFTLYVAAQFQGAGTAIATAAPVTSSTAIIVGAIIVILYVFLGGFWAASATDALQGAMMLVVALILPYVALAAVGGPAELWAGLQAQGDPGLLRLVDQPGLMLAMVFVAGLFGIGLGYPGQPHVVNRFMALRSAGEIRIARNVALIWATLIYIGMVILGWSGRVLLPELADHESVLLELSVSLLPAVIGGIITGGVLAAIMSTADSQLLVASGSVSHDLYRGRHSVRLDRAVVVLLGLAAAVLALFVPDTIFNRVLFAWQVLGNGFGPLLLVLLWRGGVSGAWRLAAMVSGAGLTILISFFPDAPGNAVERLLPFFIALAIALIGHARGNSTGR
ncbi:sodium/proline symporter [Natronospira bacteriovora]|uniref:Sodium/proline symporter n=1 Tax=Natronospira bacteriovora TaxID=3069753 RepID=A0ABU0W7Q0_9GAMM|nr:sodium/proline symporter [Natronospira sp. AB-CW4]MDQ2070039.1 sodium/proline symporter [Natronospira sp. AB-CW4]